MLKVGNNVLISQDISRRSSAKPNAMDFDKIVQNLKIPEKENNSRDLYTRNTTVSKYDLGIIQGLILMIPFIFH